MSFAGSLVNFLLISFFRFYCYLIVHIFSYIIVYDMYVLPFGVIKIYIARTRGRSRSDLDTAFVVAASSVMSPACKQLIHPVPFKQPWTHPDPTGSETKYEEFFGR